MTRDGGARAQEYLRTLVADHAARNVVRLPSIRAMAGACGVSVSTMWRAVGRAQRTGAVLCVGRGGIVLGHRGAAPVAADHAAVATGGVVEDESRWQSLEQCLEVDIRAGVLAASGRLPSYKVLSAQYGSSYPTLRRALRALVARNRIRPWKRGFARVDLPRRTRRATLVCLAVTNVMHTLRDLAPWGGSFWRLIERECARLNVDVELYGYHEVVREVARPAGVDFVSLAALQRERTTLGYLVWTMGLDTPLLRDLVRAVPRGRPVSVVQDVRDVLPELPRSAQGNRLFRSFALGMDPSAGQSVADYLLGLGHRVVACFSLGPSCCWSQSRVDGMRRAFSRVPSAQLCEYVIAGTGPDGMPEVTGMAQLQRLLRAVDRVDDDESYARFDPAERHVLKQALINYTGTRAFRKMAADSFSEALRIGGATAWVGVNDRIALLAMHYLGQHGMRVPDDISLIGFDDTLEALGCGLSSYAFNARAVATAVLEHVVAPYRSRAAADRAIEIPGSVMERRSTAVRTL